MNKHSIELPLRDIHLPDPISWWPLAPAWWITLAIVLLLSFFMVVAIRRYLKPSLRKQAVKALDRIEETFRQTDDSSQCLAELSVFLRRAVLSQKISLKSAGLTGQAWLQLLDRPLSQPEFSEGIGQLLLKGPYQAQAKKEDAWQLIKLCRKWVKCL